jgi:hypothetical protein
MDCVLCFLKHVARRSEGSHFSVLHGFEFGANGILEVLSVPSQVEESAA